MLIKIQIAGPPLEALIQWSGIGVGRGVFAFLRSTQVKQVLLVWGLHFENHLSKLFCSLIDPYSGDNVDFNNDHDNSAHLVSPCSMSGILLFTIITFNSHNTLTE